MKSFSNYTKHIPTLIFILSLGIMFTSCSKEEAIIKTSNEVIERIDMVIEQGNDKEYIYLQSEQANTSADLVDFGYFGTSAERMDFTLQLDDRRTLIFRVYNHSQPFFWELENTAYSSYSNNEINSLYKYVTAEIVSGGETSYTSNLGDFFPSETQIDVFRIMEYDEANHEMLVHFENFPLAQSSSSNVNSIVINGTFRGALTFID